MQITQKCTTFAPQNICGKEWTIRYLMGKLCEVLVLNILCTISSMQDFFLKTFKLHRFKG